MAKSGNFHTSSFIAYFVGAICAALLGIEIWNAWKAREIQLQETHAAVSNVSFALAQHANETFKEADIVLAGMTERISHDGTGPASLARIHNLLVDHVRELRSLNGLFIYDENGKWLVTSQETLLTQYNNADREYFQYHRDHPDLMPHIGPPVISRSTGKWIFTISRRISKPDGSFGGVALATINSDYFQEFYQRFEIGSEGALSMSLMNGITLYRRPLREDSIGLDLSNQPIYRDLVLQAKDGVALITSPIDGVTRYISFKRVEDYPLFVAAALSKDEALAAWAGNTLVRSIFVLTGLILVSFFGHRLHISAKSRELAETRLRQAKRKLASLNRSLAQMALHDGLTSLANRRYFDQTLEAEMSRAYRTAGNLSLLMIDVDFFKLYNDRYGHQQGDDCLKKIADAIETCVRRPGDLAARYGGEEFAVILPGCTREGAQQIATLICETVRSLHLPHEGNASGIATVSVGVATADHPPAENCSAQLLSAADAALYTAKSSGRDRAIWFAPDLTTQDLAL
ncbi:sensor domain-containing diguanylate cyclase [Herbaspirillum sp. NPDC087042]|uniref:sensor domain-containing diguanylate cyclase n=1 Tax=Herbaspirillum sp. NPDC087042 TaxID=3364004 RepID=UPI003828EF9A